MIQKDKNNLIMFFLWMMDELYEDLDHENREKLGKDVLQLPEDYQTKEYFEKNIKRWNEILLTLKNGDWKNGLHFGDCTDYPMTCMRCYVKSEYFDLINDLGNIFDKIEGATDLVEGDEYRVFLNHRPIGYITSKDIPQLELVKKYLGIILPEYYKDFIPSLEIKIDPESKKIRTSIEEKIISVHINGSLRWNHKFPKDFSNFDTIVEVSKNCVQVTDRDKIKEINISHNSIDFII